MANCWVMRASIKGKSGGGEDRGAVGIEGGEL